MESSSMNHPDEPLLTATRENLESFHDDVQYLWCSDIPVYESPPSALNFLRNHVALSRPCIIRNSILTTISPPDEKANEGTSGSDASNAATSAVPLTMTIDDLVRLFPNVDENNTGVDENDSPSSYPSEEGSISLPPLCVDVTPDGHGDCLRRVAIDDGATPLEEEKVFVKPLETDMSLSEFCRRLRKGRAKQQQQVCHDIDREDILDKVFESSSSGSRENRDKADSNNNDDNDDLFEDCVLYYSRQNDCLREELSPLWNMKRSSNETDGDDDNADSFLFPRSFPWADEAFFGQPPVGAANDNSIAAGIGPDAVNLWMGDERAVSAMHKDHYENLFYVLSGEKVFGLCPPSDAPFLYEKEVISGRFEVSSRGSHDDGNKQQLEPTRNWSVVLDREADTTDPSSSSDEKYSKVHWIATDLFGTNPDRTDEDEEFPLSKYAHPITVKVRAGELLYLPSLWFHRVTQTRETIGINYWYNMNFESPMWCYFHLLQQLRSREQSTNDKD
jgi:hypothetical protein